MNLLFKKGVLRFHYCQDDKETKIIPSIELGTLKTFKYLESIGFLEPFNTFTEEQCKTFCECAAKFNKLDLLRYFREEKKCVWSSVVISTAMEEKHFDILEYAFTNDCPIWDPIDYEALSNYLYYGSSSGWLTPQQILIFYNAMKKSISYPSKMKQLFRRFCEEILSSEEVYTMSEETESHIVDLSNSIPQTPLLTEGPQMPSVWDPPLPSTTTISTTFDPPSTVGVKRKIRNDDFDSPKFIKSSMENIKSSENEKSETSQSEDETESLNDQETSNVDETPKL